MAKKSKESKMEKLKQLLGFITTPIEFIQNHFKAMVFFTHRRFNIYAKR
jgi:hypothetical protein